VWLFRKIPFDAMSVDLLPEAAVGNKCEVTFSLHDVCSARIFTDQPGAHTMRMPEAEHGAAPAPPGGGGALGVQLSKAERGRTATKLVVAMTAMMLLYMITAQVKTTPQSTNHVALLLDFSRTDAESRSLFRLTPRSGSTTTAALRGPGQDPSEKDAKLAQNLGQLQPFLAVFSPECMGQLASSGPT
jgi:hypothetical protein